jgi:hypothetical protein
MSQDLSHFCFLAVTFCPYEEDVDKFVVAASSDPSYVDVLGILIAFLSAAVKDHKIQLCGE